MPKQRRLKNRNDEQEQPQQHVGKGQQQSMPTNELQQQPPRKMTITVKKGGQPREYHYRTTVNSFEELDDVRFQNYVRFTAARHKLLNFMKITMPCTTRTRKMSDPNCDFELRALRSADGHNIDVYEYSQHNHSFESDEKRLSKGEMELVPDGNPPSIFRTLDNIEWTFYQKLADYDTLDKFRSENQCYHTPNIEHRSRIRYYCTGRRFGNCKFILLALKTTKKRYHVYKNGEHNHPMHKIKKKQKKARGKQKNRQEQMEDADEEEEVPMEEEQQEDESIDGEQNAEDIAKPQPGQDEQMATDCREYPLEKCQRRLQSNLRKDNKERTKKWVGRIDRADIGQVIAELDIENVANLMRIADIDISDCETSLDFWLPWIKKTIHKRGAELIEFIDQFKHLRNIKSLPNKLKGKIQKMLDKLRLEMEAQKVMVPEETSSDDEN